MPAGPSSPRPLIARPRLLERLALRWERRLVILIAGPGFGKTSLLVQAMDDARAHAAGRDVWYQCGPADAAASRLAAGLCGVLGVADQAPSEEALVRAVAEAGVDICFVLDDVHEIEPGSAGTRFLAGLLNALPPNGHVLASSRTAPFAVTRLLAQGRAERLRDADLAFTDEEVDAFADARHVDPQRLAGVGGWPALAELVASAGHDVARDFLWEEVLDGLPQDRRRVLAALSVVGGGDDEIASALAGRSVRVADVVAGIPLVRADEQGWQRVHALWEPALAPLLAPREADEARVVAGRVLRGHGRHDGAFRLFVAASAWDEARCTVVEALGAHGWAAEDVPRAWLALLPEDQRRQPEGMLLEGIARKQADPMSPQPLLDAAAAAFRERDDAEGELTAIAHSVQLAWRREDSPALMALLARAFELEADGIAEARPLAALGRALAARTAGDLAGTLSALDGAPEGAFDGDWGGIADWLRGETMLDLGDPESALACARRGMRSTSARLAAWGLLAKSQWLRGHVDEAVELMRSLRRELELIGGGRRVFAERSAWGALGESIVGSLDVAAADLASAEDAVTRVPSAERETLVALGRGLLAAGRGDDVTATAAVRAALAQRPLGEDVAATRLHEKVLAVTYVLVPETRPFWDEAPLAPAWARTREVARAVAAAREGGRVDITSLRGWFSPELVRSHVPVPWSVNLAVHLAAAGCDEGRQLVEDIGAVARPFVRSLTSRRGAIGTAAKRVLSRIPAEPETTLEVSVLGPLELRRDGVPVESADWRRERVRSLVLFLVANPKTTRPAVGAALWPDLDEDAAAHNLRVTLSYLLRVLEPERVEGEASFYVRQSGVWLRLEGLTVDAWELEHHLADAAAARRAGATEAALASTRTAVDLYRGDYLAEAAVDEWAFPHRDRLRWRTVAAALQAGEALLERGDPDDALRIATRALDIERYSEPAFRLQAAAHLARRDRAAALRTMEACGAMLDELATEPEPATHALMRSIGVRREAVRP